MSNAMKLLSIFRIRPEERRPALAVLLALIVLQACGISSLWETFSTESLEDGDVFFRDFHVSGFDPITYFVTTFWRISTYQVYRHPLLALLVLPFYAINQLLILLTGYNLVQLVLALPLLFSGVYTFIFLYRILCEQVSLLRFDALLLCWMFMGFAYVMVPLTVADHFAVSMLLLVGALYVSGIYMQRHQQIGMLPATLMFLLTAGVTLSNGLKIFIDLLFVNGRHFFRPRFLLMVVVVPVAMLWGFATWTDTNYVQPKEKARKMTRLQAERERRQNLHATFVDTTSIADSAAIEQAFNRKYRSIRIAEAKERAKKLHKGKPISTKSEFAHWTDIGTDRCSSLVENFFGESIQLHSDYLLGDTLRDRPVIVPYRSWLNYVVEVILVALFLAGIVAGWRSRFLWMALSGFAVDLAIHLGLGFGLNEVYIMAPHWLFVMPIATAFLLRRPAARSRFAIRTVLLLTTIFLWMRNGYLLISFYCSNM